jgi:hypothetical protein
MGLRVNKFSRDERVAPDPSWGTNCCSRLFVLKLRHLTDAEGAESQK